MSPFLRPLFFAPLFFAPFLRLPFSSPNEQFGRDGLIDNHLGFARGLRGGDVLGDDFSMLEVRFGAVPEPKRKKKPSEAS